MIDTNENIAAGGITLAGLEKLTRSFADDYNGLRAIAADIQSEQDAVLKKYLPALRKAAARTQASRAELLSDLVAAPELFADKKTRVFHGVKIGFRKGKGSMEIADEEQFLKKLETMFPDESARGIYLSVQVTPLKAALAELPAGDLKKLGVTIEDTGDVALVKPVDGDVDKYVAALLKPEPPAE